MLNLGKYILLLQFINLVTSFPTRIPDSPSVRLVVTEAVVEARNAPTNVNGLKAPQDTVVDVEHKSRNVNGLKGDVAEARKTVLDAKISSTNSSGLKAIFDQLGNRGSWQMDTVELKGVYKVPLNQGKHKVTHNLPSANSELRKTDISLKSSFDGSADLNTASKVNDPAKTIVEARSLSSNKSEDAGKNTSAPSELDHVRLRRHSAHDEQLYHQIANARIAVEKTKEQEPWRMENVETDEQKNKEQHNIRIFVSADQERNNQQRPRMACQHQQGLHMKSEEEKNSRQHQHQERVGIRRHNHHLRPVIRPNGESGVKLPEQPGVIYVRTDELKSTARNPLDLGQVKLDDEKNKEQHLVQKRKVRTNVDEKQKRDTMVRNIMLHGKQNKPKKTNCC